MTVNTLYFAQHGLAVDKADDPERPLSTAGNQQTTKVAEFLKDSKTPITNVFHSGKLRAQQTAAIFARVLNNSSTSAIDGLLPNDDVAMLAQNLNTNNALYVGHLPQLENVVTFLATNRTDPAIITFKNSAVVCLKQTNHHYSVQWYLTPDLITR